MMRPSLDSLSSLSDDFLMKLHSHDEGVVYCDDFLDEGDAYALEDLLQLSRDRIEFDIDGISPTSFLESDEDALVWGLSVLCGSSIMRSMAFDARYEDWALEVDDITADAPILDPQLRIVIIPRGTPSLAALNRSSHERCAFLLHLATALRMIWQSMNGVHTRHDLTADDQILFERCVVADRDIIVARAAWDLKDGDFSIFWRHLISGPCGDIALYAAGLWDDDSDEAHLPAHLAELFLVWMHDSQLVNLTDCRTLDLMDERLEKSAHSVCGALRLNPSDLMAIARLPEGLSYLAPLSRTLLYSEFVRHMPDPLNESHLRQILEEMDSHSSMGRESPLVFQDEALAAKIFPNRLLDTQA